jgi:RNA polymerase sigma-70 factor (ECF subfamily)
MLTMPTPHRTPPQDRVTHDLAELIDVHQAGVWRYLRYLGASPPEADDLTQETFLELARGRFEHRSAGETAAYLRTTARHALLQARRRLRRGPVVLDLAAAEGVWNALVAPVDTSDSNDRWALLIDAARRCVEGLEGRSRQAIELSYREQRTRDDCAAALGMTPDGVKTLLRRTREALRACIERRVAE